MRKWIYFGLGFFLIFLFSIIYYQKSKLEKELNFWKNQSIANEKTVELQNGVFARSAQQVDDLTKLLNTAQTEQKNLKQQLEKSKSQVLVLTDLTINLKKNYEVLTKATQSTVKDKNNQERTRVDFSQDLGIFHLNGYTLTNPAIAFLQLSQIKPLKLSLAISQNEDKTWKVYVTSNENNNDIKIDLAAVNPLVFSPKWYERLGIVSYLGGGIVNNHAGALLGLGLSVDFSSFSLGPAVLFSTTGLADRYYGISFTYRPFLRKN